MAGLLVAVLAGDLDAQRGFRHASYIADPYDTSLPVATRRC